MLRARAALWQEYLRLHKRGGLAPAGHRLGSVRLSPIRVQLRKFNNYYISRSSESNAW
jgi:hypothetical protein